MTPSEILAIKTLVRHRDGYRCVGCGMTQAEHFTTYGSKLEAYRLIHGSAYAFDETCQTLCLGCHTEWDRKRQTSPKPPAG
jgi:hypothetical protein